MKGFSGGSENCGAAGAADINNAAYLSSTGGFMVYRYFVDSRRFFARSSWKPLESFLNQQLPDQQFHIRPLDLHQMQEAVKNGSVQFVVTHPGQFVQLNNHLPLRWLASLRASHGIKTLLVA